MNPHSIDGSVPGLHPAGSERVGPDAVSSNTLTPNLQSTVSCATSGALVKHFIDLANREAQILADLKRHIEAGDRDAVFRSASLLVNLSDGVAAPPGAAKIKQKT